MRGLHWHGLPFEKLQGLVCSHQNEQGGLRSLLAAAMNAVLFENSAKNLGMILLHLWVVQKAPAELMPRGPLLAHRRAVVFAIAP